MDREKVTEVLLQNYANVNSKNNDGNTPRHKSAEKGFVNLVKLLIDYGANVNSKGRFGCTVIQLLSLLLKAVLLQMSTLRSMQELICLLEIIAFFGVWRDIGLNYRFDCHAA